MTRPRTSVLRTTLSTLPLILAAACSPPGAAPPPAVPTSPVDTYVAHRDADLGVPTFIWLDAQPNPGADAKEVAWRVLRELSTTYRMDPDALAATKVASVHDIGQGTIIVQFEQEVDGIEVFRNTLAVALTRELQPVGVTGHLSPGINGAAEQFALSSDEAVQKALVTMVNGAVPPVRADGAAKVPAGYRAHSVAPFVTSGVRYSAARPPRSKRVLYPTGSKLIPAYYVELDLSLNNQPDSTLKSYVVSATDGAVLFENDLTAADSYTYRVWGDKDAPYTPWDGPHGNGFTPHPTGKKDGTTLTFVPSQLVKLESLPFSKKDPWLPAMAADATGNNAIAYADIAAPDGLGTGDVMLKPSAPGEFDYMLDAAKDNPAKDNKTIQAVTTNFFYIINYLHDTYYDAGWDEASRNPQKDNYGRGGVANDPIKAESQDNSGRNNANASTPADGNSPRIQMYLFDPQEDALKVTSPMDLARAYVVGRASFGPGNFDVTADLVIVDDGGGTAMMPTDGCEGPFKNAMDVKDKIAVVDRGNCYFEEKAAKAQENGAKAVVIINNVTGAPGGMAPAPTPPPTTVTIPAVMISMEDGTAIRAKLMAGTAVTMQMRALMVNNDSSLDGMIVSHEWGHVMSNRLIGNANGLVNNQGRAMGEGWSDFVALLLTTRPEDIMASANANWSGAFAAAGYSLGPAGNSAYDGIRRFPYSTDMAKNPLTFKYIMNGVPLPATPPPAFGADGISNAQVHNSGEVWANALWECYVSLLRDTGRYTFAQAQKAMREYLVAGLKLTPVSPTMLEARDAILLAVYGKDQKDFELFARAFARRGMGVGAVGPSKTSTTHAGVVESFAVGGNIVVESITLTDTVRSCDNDGVLDTGELGVLTVKLRNTGTLPFSARATVTSESGAVVFPTTNKIAFVTDKPYQSVTGKVIVALNTATTALPFELKLNFDAADLAKPGPVVVRRSFVGNYDVSENSSADDLMNDAGSKWTTAADTTLDVSEPWRQVFDGSNGGWFIPDHVFESDQYLISPALQVAKTGNFGFSFRHRHVFEADTFNNYDGGVVEVSADGGMTWVDTAASYTANGYNGTLWSLNDVLKSRKAFANTSAGYPGYITSTVNLGTTYAGKTVKIRFRVGTDADVGAIGWDVDEVRFTGIDNTPFPSRQRNRLTCP